MFGKKEDPRVDKLIYEVDGLKNALQEMKQTLVRIEEFKPVKSLVYGATGLILVAVLGGLLATIGLQ